MQLVRRTCRRRDIVLIDCQVVSEHLSRLGSRAIGREAFLATLKQHCQPHQPSHWTTTESAELGASPGPRLSDPAQTQVGRHNRALFKPCGGPDACETSAGKDESEEGCTLEKAAPAKASAHVKAKARIKAHSAARAAPVKKAAPAKKQATSSPTRVTCSSDSSHAIAATGDRSEA